MFPAVPAVPKAGTVGQPGRGAMARRALPGWPLRRC